MPLDYHHQVALLKDILSDHQTDCCGTIAECEQLERVIKSLMTNSNIDQNLKNILQQIYQYSQSGVNSSGLNQHIQSSQQNLTQWIHEIDTFS
ncbi:YtzH-like family protein [Metabacillus arenae]|uniref:YtzH-like family protein n=1 Tax=Metabacillus arenae TaxID=2771434 RepID=A0A926NLU2_9BACI|nr:YtzH-like family protein [Metabacillus arenae]MBD1380181.1 YtzH-like family protein [Metabacillus arenae]